ncbi:MAG: hypothetical protein ACOZIN_11800, partial [Myxococcota bacterium]
GSSTASRCAQSGPQVSSAVSRLMRADSIYSAELSKRGLAWELTLEGRRVFKGQPHPLLGEGALPLLAPSAPTEPRQGSNSNDDSII